MIEQRVRKILQIEYEKRLLIYDTEDFASCFDYALMLMANDFTVYLYDDNFTIYFNGGKGQLSAENIPFKQIEKSLKSGKVGTNLCSAVVTSVPPYKTDHFDTKVSECLSLYLQFFGSMIRSVKQS